MNNAFQITTAYRIEQLEKRLASLEESLSLLGQRVTSMDKVTDRLMKQNEIKIEVTERPVIQVSKDLLELKSCRKKEAVAERWGAWEKLDRAGVRPSEIAKAFNCDDGSVLFAKKKGFKSGWIAKAESRRMVA